VENKPAQPNNPSTPVVPPGPSALDQRAQRPTPPSPNEPGHPFPIPAGNRPVELEHNSPFWKKKWFLAIVLLLVILVPLIVFGASKLAAPAPTPTPPAVITPKLEATPDPTAGWSTSSESAELSFKYPSSWAPEVVTGIPSSSQREIVNIYSLPRVQGIEVPVVIIDTYDTNHKGLEQDQKNLTDMQSLLNLTIGEKLQVVGTMYTRGKDTTVDGLTAQVYEGVAVPNYPAEVFPYEKRVIVKTDTRLYNFASAGDKNNPNLKLFDQFLTTVKFVEPVDFSDPVSLTKGFLKDWLAQDGSPSAKAENMLAKGYITQKASNSIKAAVGLDLPTCSQNPLAYDLYQFSVARYPNPTSAEVDVKANYSQSVENYTYNQIKSGADWRIDSFTCPK
jgi:hypothetical protein